MSTPGEQCDAEQDRCHERARAALGQGRDVLLSASASLNGTSPYAISQALGRITAMLVKEDRAGGLVLTGGDTAKAVCLQLNTTGIELLDEVELGIPVGRLVGDHPLSVITKAGAFGHEGALLRAIRYLKGEHEDE